MTTLRKYYNDGLILYPRVENGYIKDSLFSYFPHPELPILNKYFEPLKKEFYDLCENSFLLHLHNKRYFNISQTIKVQNTIKENFSTKSNNVKNKSLINNYLSFLDLKKQTELDYFLKSQLEHFASSKPMIYHIDYNNKDFIENIDSLNDKIQNINKNELKKDEIIANQVYMP